MEMMELSTAPTIFSHSCARALWDHDRNIRDEQITACARTGGVIGINGVGFFLTDNDASPEQFVRHVEYVGNLVGRRHVAIGLDLVYYMDSMLARWRANPGRYPEGYPEPPWHFLPPEEIPRIVELLVDRDWSDDEIFGLLGENFLRVAAAVWK
jgi:membrane dipeptidase